MLLYLSTIAKLLQQYFIGDSPIIKKTSEHDIFLSALKEHLILNEDIKQIDRYWDNTSECCFKIKVPSFIENRFLTIAFTPTNELSITIGSHTVPIYHLEQIDTFIDRLKLEYNKIQWQHAKAEKILHLKQKAIMAKIKEIAKEEQFDFYTSEYATKLKILVRMPQNRILEVDVPYGKFQAVLKNMRDLIITIRALHNSGITFRLKSYSHHDKHCTWITHDSL
ncbi:MAG: hypothetical protein KAH77_10935 [Thiomargarita sp.]|nr:hypothetical protein [Thiomargarita sp.]